MLLLGALRSHALKWLRRGIKCALHGRFDAALSFFLAVSVGVHFGEDTMAKPTKVSALERHPAYPKALGILSAEIGVLEMLLGELLGAILGIETHLGQVIYNSPQSYTGRLDIPANVISVTLKPTIPGTVRLNGFIKRTRARIQYRNTVMHSLWGIKQSDPSIVTRREVPLLPDRPQIPVPLRELQDEIAKVRTLIDEVEQEIPEVIKQRLQFFA